MHQVVFYHIDMSRCTVNKTKLKEKKSKGLRCKQFCSTHWCMADLKDQPVRVMLVPFFVQLSNTLSFLLSVLTV